MRRWLGLGLLGLCTWATFGVGAPLLPQKMQDFKLAAFSHRVQAVPFRGGERALVIASSSGRIPLALYVYDSDGNCVAHDDYGDPSQPGGEAAVAWYPPRDERYTVELRNLGSSEQSVILVMR